MSTHGVVVFDLKAMHPFLSLMQGVDPLGQPIDKEGRLLGRLLVDVGGLKLYPPRMMRDLGRTARAERRASERERRFWDREIWPRVRQIHKAGGTAFARDLEGSDDFDIWRTQPSPQCPDGLTFTHEKIKIAQGDEPLVQTAHLAVSYMDEEGPRFLNRDLGMALTRAYARANRGNIMLYRDVTSKALHWGMRQLIKRECGETTPGQGPALIRIRFAGIEGEWVWQRDQQGFGWKLLTSPSDDTHEIHVP